MIIGRNGEYQNHSLNGWMETNACKLVLLTKSIVSEKAKDGECTNKTWFCFW